MKKKKLYSLISVPLTGILVFMAAVGFYPSTAVAATPNERVAELNELINNSLQVISTIEGNGVDMEKLLALPQKDEAFFDMSFEEISELVGMPQGYTSKSIDSRMKTAQENSYQEVFLKQLQVIYQEAKENQARGMSSMNSSFEDEIKYQFISHYVDGQGGFDMYLTPYGYQSWNLANWVTDMDRGVFQKVIKSVETTRELDRIVDFSKSFYDEKIDPYYSVRGFFEGGINDKLAFAFEQVLDRVAKRLGIEKEEVDINQYILTASTTMENASTMSELQENLLHNLTTEYKYLDDFTGKLIVSLISLLLFGVLPGVGVGVAFAFTIITAPVKLYHRLNLTYLSLTRNARIPERICDQMEYEGIW